MTCTTWEQAAREAADDAVEHYWPRPISSAVALDEVERHLECIKDRSPFPGILSRWRWVANDALVGFLGDTLSKGHFEWRLGEIVDTIVSKQHDYGHENILWGGLDGIVVRAHDKVARIRNLEDRGVDPANESVADSWSDLVGYALIGYMLERGTFTLPLAADVVPEPNYLTYTEWFHRNPGGYNPIPNFEDAWPSLVEDTEPPPLFDAEEEEAIRDVVSAMPFTFDFGEADEVRIRELAKEVVDAEVEDFDVLERRVKAWIGDGLAEYKTTVRSLISEAITSHWFVAHNKPSVGNWTLVGAR